jgi:hypothetical protein
MYNILIKFPTRGRPDKFFKVLDCYISKAKNLSKIAFVISFDEDDKTMNNSKVLDTLQAYKNKIKLVYFIGGSKTKIQAVNADMEKVSGWDILLLASDDMIPVEDGYDEIIRQDMENNFKDTDGVLWYHDGAQNRLNTLSILGKKYYDRFNYIYHPDYVSLWCDNEFTEVSERLKRVHKSDRVIIEHQHPAWQKSNFDELYARNEMYNSIDKQTYDRRSEKNFFIDFNNIKLSILMLGISNRLDYSKKIFKKIEDQINNLNTKEVELLFLIDNKNQTVGSKRQSLLDISRGSFVCFMDDDDDISDDYVSEILSAIKSNPNVDVINFKQKARINNDVETDIIFSIKHKTNDDYYPGGVIKRLPFHICVWNKKIASQVRFPNISKVEDWAWAKELCLLATTEYNIDKYLHYYIFNSETTTS